MYTISILLLGILVLFKKLSNGEKFDKEKKEIYTWLSVVTLALTACFHFYILSYFLQMGKQYIQMFKKMRVDVSYSWHLWSLIGFYCILDIFESKIIPAANLVIIVRTDEEEK